MECPVFRVCCVLGSLHVASHRNRRTLNQMSSQFSFQSSSMILPRQIGLKVQCILDEANSESDRSLVYTCARRKGCSHSNVGSERPTIGSTLHLRYRPSSIAASSLLPSPPLHPTQLTRILQMLMRMPMLIRRPRSARSMRMRMRMVSSVPVAVRFVPVGVVCRGEGLCLEERVGETVLELAGWLWVVCHCGVFRFRGWQGMRGFEKERKKEEGRKKEICRSTNNMGTGRARILIPARYLGPADSEERRPGFLARWGGGSDSDSDSEAIQDISQALSNIRLPRLSVACQYGRQKGTCHRARND